MIHTKNISDCWTLYVPLCCIIFVIPSGPKWSHLSRPDCPADRIPEQKVQTLNTFSYFFIFPWVIVNQYININQYIWNSRYDSNVPLVLMNSFNTDEDTMKIIRFVSNLQISSKLIFHQNLYNRKYSVFKVQIRTFNQSRYPRINRESLMPVARSVLNTFLWMVDSFFMDIFLRTRSCKTEDDINAWYPPGHGDFYQVLVSLGPVTFFFSCPGQFNRWHCQSVTCDLSDKDKDIERNLVI